MSHWLAVGLSMLIGVGSGVIIATGILAFATMLGVIPRLMTRTDSRTHYFAVGNAAMLGIVVGNIIYMWDIHLQIPKVCIGVFSLLFGMFIGCLSIAIAEVLDIIPITRARLKLKKGMGIIILAFAFGKMLGSLYYWFYPAFVTLK